MLHGPCHLSSAQFERLAMLAACRNQHWQEARELMETCASLDHCFNKLYDVDRDRIGQYERTSPGSNWDGVFIALTKQRGGECNVGNLGSEQHFNYSVLGDAVNLSSRLEGQAKFYGCPIVVGENTAQAAGAFAFLELDLIRVVGKQQPSHIFALLGDSTLGEDPAFAALAESHAEMIQAYRGADWARAAEHLDRCQARADGLPLAKLYDIYAERLADHATNPDMEQWDGIYEALQK